MSLYLRCVRNTMTKYGRAWERSLPAAAGCRNYTFAATSKQSQTKREEVKFSTIANRWFHVSSTRFEVVTVKCPQFAESISEGDVRWEKSVGDEVAIDDTVAEVETDKTGIPIPSPANGVIEALLVEDGATVQPGMDLFKINTSGSAAAAPPKPAAEAPTPAAAPAAAAPTPVPATMPPVPAAPKQPMESRPSPPVASLKRTPAVTDDTAVSASVRSESRVKMNRMRQRISQRLKDSQNTAAMLTTFNEIDMTNIIAFRNRHKDAFQKKHGLKLSFMSAFIKASTYALKDQPTVNAVIDDDTNEIVYRDYVDISVAVATPKGLVVPVLRDCNNMNYLDIDREMNVLATKARENRLTVEDMDGGTFTISNGGVFGSMFGTPIINLPQSSILGMHATIERPVAINGKVEIRPMMYVALTYDHRLIDGREAVTFLKKIKQGVEDPLTLEIQL